MEREGKIYSAGLKLDDSSESIDTDEENAQKIEQAKFVRSTSTVEMDGPIKFGMFPLIYCGKYIGITVLLNEMT